MNFKTAAILAVLLGGLILAFLWYNRPAATPPAAPPPTATSPPPTGSPTPAWVNTIRDHPRGGWDDKDLLNAMILAIEAGPYGVSRLTDLIADTTADYELTTIDDIVFELVRRTAKHEYIGLGRSLEIRAKTLGTYSSAVVIYTHYKYNEVQQFMLPILMNEADNSWGNGRSAAAGWLRDAWEREPFPEALKEEKDAFFAVLNSAQNKRLADPLENTSNQILFFDLLLSLVKMGVIDCDEALDRLETNLREVTGPAVRGEKDWRVAEIREACR